MKSLLERMKDTAQMFWEKHIERTIQRKTLKRSVSAVIFGTTADFMHKIVAEHGRRKKA